MTQVLDLWDRLGRLPLGDRVFSVLFSLKAPYFATVRPHFRVVEPNRAVLTIRKRRGVHNHIGTVHVIAICNGLEAAMGALAEASVPADKRWIPRGMEVSYPAKADTDVTCHAETDPAQWSGDDPDVPVRVWATRADGTVVVEGVIRLWVTERPTATPAVASLATSGWGSPAASPRCATRLPRCATRSATGGAVGGREGHVRGER